MKFQDYAAFFVLFLIMCYQVYGSEQLCPSPLPEQYEHMQPGKVVSAYFGNWDVYGTHQYQVDRIQAVANKLTHVVYGFMKPDDVTGECYSHDAWADIGVYDGFQSKIGGSFGKLIALKQKFPHLKILLSIGGGKYNKNFVKIAQDQEKLMKFAQSCIDRLSFYEHVYEKDGIEQKNHLNYEDLFDGIDLDWEWNVSALTPELSQVYTQFVQELRRLLDIRAARLGKKMTLTVALQVTPKIYKNLDLGAITPHIDWFHVMAYDFYGPYSGLVGFNAPVCGKNIAYSVDGALQGLMQLGVGPDKMVLGLPLYGYVFEDSAGYNSTIKKVDQVKTMSYHLIKSKYFNDEQVKHGWNSYEKVPAAFNQKDRIFISYDSKTSLQEKVKLAKDKRLQGVVIWRLSGDDAQHSMVHAIAQAMKN